MTGFEERIHNLRADLSPSHERLAAFLLDSYAHAALLSATELAHKLDVDTGTVVRFSQRLGYRGYPELHDELRQKVRSELLIEQLEPPGSAGAAATAAFEQVRQALQLSQRTFATQDAIALLEGMNQAARIFVLSEGLARAPAHQFVSWLTAAGYAVQIVTPNTEDLTHFLAGARPADMLLVIEVRNASALTLLALQEAQRARLTCGAIVAAASTPIAREADLVLAAYDMPHPETGLITVECMLFALKRMLQMTHPQRFAIADERIQTIRHLLQSEGES